MVWGCMLWDWPGYACNIDCSMNVDLKKAWPITANLLRTSSFNRTMTLNIPAKGPGIVKKLQIYSSTMAYTISRH